MFSTTHIYALYSNRNALPYQRCATTAMDPGPYLGVRADGPTSSRTEALRIIAPHRVWCRARPMHGNALSNQRRATTALDSGLSPGVCADGPTSSQTDALRNIVPYTGWCRVQWGAADVLRV